MARNDLSMTGVARTFPDTEIIVSKTDAKGRLTYVNDIFSDVSGYREDEVLGEPHSLIRHPDMPRCVFKLLWDTIQNGEEVFAYVNNRAKNGDHYWVLAHVTPTLAADGSIAGYHSSRRSPRQDAVAAIEPVYETLRGIETRTFDRKAGLEQSTAALHGLLEEKGVSYDQFVLAI